MPFCPPVERTPGGFYLKPERSGSVAWEWDNSEKLMQTPRQICRDTVFFEFKKPNQEIESLQSCAGIAITHDKKEKECVQWNWSGDGRIFKVPVDILQYMPDTSMFRDVVACISQLYREQKYPPDYQIATSYRQIADNLGLSWNGGLPKEIGDLLTFAKYFTIDNMRIITELNKDGTIKNSELRAFGFIAEWGREDITNGIKIPENKAKVLINLTKTYADMIKNLVPAPVPVEALIQARTAPRRLIGTTKNMVYRLAARVPQQKITYNTDTLRNIMGISSKTRSDKALKTIDRVLQILYPIMIRDFDLTKDKATVFLAGKLTGGKTDI